MNTTVPASSDAADMAEFRRMMQEIKQLREEMHQQDEVIAHFNEDIAISKAESRRLQDSADNHIKRALAVLDSLHSQPKV